MKQRPKRRGSEWMVISVNQFKSLVKMTMRRREKERHYRSLTHPLDRKCFYIV